MFQVSLAFVSPVLLKCCETVATIVLALGFRLKILVLDCTTKPMRPGNLVHYSHAVAANHRVSWSQWPDRKLRGPNVHTSRNMEETCLRNALHSGGGALVVLFLAFHGVVQHTVCQQPCLKFDKGVADVDALDACEVKDHCK